MAIALRGITLEEFLRRPERKPALELEDGVVQQRMTPKGRHSLLQGEFVYFFRHATGRRRRLIALPELRVTFGGFSRVPDVAVYRAERVPRDAAGRVVDDF